MKGGFVILLFLVIIISALDIMDINIAVNIEEENASSVPQIRFVWPTPINNSYNSLPITVNYTATDANLQSAFLDLNKTLALWLRMNNASDENNTHVKDSSGYGNNGTALNGANLTASGIMGTAYAFGGDNEYINVTDKPEFSPANYNLTIALWIKPATFDFAANDISSLDAIHFLSKANSGGEYEWMFRLYNSSNPSLRPKRVSFYGCNWTGGLCVGSYFEDNLTENEWIHIAGVINRTSISIYKNGILRDMDYHNLDLQDGNAPVRIGRNSDNTAPTNSFNGSIDDVMIFNMELTANEILAIYNATSPFITSHNLPYGNYTIRAFAQDLNGTVNSTEERVFRAGNMTITLLISPLNNTFSGIKNMPFVCNSTGNSLSNISLYINANGSWSANATRAISGTANQSNITVIGIADGTYIWNCKTKDTSNNQAFNSTNYTITIDTAAPSSISLSAPDEGYSSTSTTVNFNISANDILDTNLTCNITVDSQVAISTLVANGTFRAISTSVSVGSHQWNVRCYDNALNSNKSITRNFTITQETAASPGTSDSSSSGSSYSKNTESYVYNDLAGGDTININLAKDNTSFTNAKIAIANSAPKATISIKPVTEIPGGFDNLGKIVYKSIEARTNLLATDILSVNFKFKVANSWLKLRDIKPDDIVLYRFSSAWNELPTYLISKDNSYAYYGSSSPGLSYFTIASKELDAAQSNESTQEIESIEDPAVENVTVTANDGANEDRLEDPLKTGLLSMALVTTIAYGFLLEKLMKKRIIG